MITSYFVWLVGIFTIVGFFLPAATRRQKFLHAAYIFMVSVLAGGLVYYESKLSRIENVQRVASKLVDDRAMKYSDNGFVLATLTFLEANSDLYPDTYKRALDTCDVNDCMTKMKTGTDADFENTMTMSRVAVAFNGMLMSIVELNSDR